MKTKNFFKNSKRVLAAFLLTGAMSVAIWSVANYDPSNAMYNAQSNDTEMSGTLSNVFSNAVIKQVKEINVEIAKLEQKKAKVMNKLEKAKADRNKEHAMVAGMYYHPAVDVSEMAILEGQVKKLDNKIAALEKKEKNLALK